MGAMLALAYTATYPDSAGPLVLIGCETCNPVLEYRELERCGHYPWLEKAARVEFFSVLRE